MSPTARASTPRRVLFFVFPGFQSLDLSGPLEVLACATWTVADGQDAGYENRIVAARAGPVRSGSGFDVVAHHGLEDDLGSFDTLVVVGGPGIVDVASDPLVVRSIKALAARARRVASVCTGAFLLGAAGLLDGHRATTHWQYVEALAHAFPAAKVEQDALYTVDGPVVTSAGVMAGMDVALALVEHDMGRAVAMRVARYLVMYVHRSGRQSQTSAQLADQSAATEALDDTKAFVLENLRADLSVEALAARVAMSPRNFARVFKQRLGITPAAFVERARLDAARRLLEQTSASVSEVAVACGFGLPETLRRVFSRRLGTSPAEYRKSPRERSDRTTKGV